MYGLFKDWQGEPYKEAPLFYQGVNAELASILERMSSEIQALRERMEECFPCVDFSYVRPLVDWLHRFLIRKDIEDPIQPWKPV
jgi:hypothetical protein